ncbi:MAG: ATP-binding protein, partial [Bdellovibrionaceae bacterium]|nr:ATP-binding protein [Pseudobdellovibrionaceae bacterium]
GIPLEVRDKIMVPLYTTKGPGSGTGLGLALSLRFIENHGGRLYFDHDRPHTTIVIEIPMGQSS